VAVRVLTFADAEIIRLACEDFVPVAGDDWYQRRRQDPEGEFFRKVADQGPHKGAGGSTRQGIYCLTADGKLLAYRNHQDPKVMRQVLKQALAEWKKLPGARRKPGAVEVVEPAKVDQRYTLTLPQGGLIVNVYTRVLDRDEKGALCSGTSSKAGGDRPAHDHLWLTQAEWKALIPAKAKKGDTLPMPAKVALRIFRFHLLDNTRGEPPLWHKHEVRSGKITLTVEEVGAKGVRLRLDGSALLATEADTAKAKRGFEVRLLGYLDYNAGSKKIDRFNLVAVGEHWGESNLTHGARPGRTPLGIAFELASGNSPADLVPPQAARYLPGYLDPTR
jgi:hypothetical protein